MLARSKDFFLQAVGARLIALLAMDPHQQLRL